ncbi:MAG: DUF6616 family protein [Rhodothermales bacterium]|nr:DUF6616 family protein [Rhodothermales bacterium]
MHLYVELWNARPAWLTLSAEERHQYFETVGAERGGVALNEDGTPHRAGYRYRAAWKMPGPERVEMLERSAARRRAGTTTSSRSTHVVR